MTEQGRSLRALAATIPADVLCASSCSADELGALKHVAAQDKTPLPAKTFIEGSVGIGAIATGFAIEVQLEIHLPGMARSVAEELVRKAHVVCPYSNATRNNIDVALQVITG